MQDVASMLNRYLSFALPVTLTLNLCACVSDDGAGEVADRSVGMVVTANPHATRVGADIIRAGGSAVDAAIAIESVLSLVEPQSSGMAGGAFLVYFDNASNEITAYDGRESAPANASPTMFLDENGEPFHFLAAKHSGISTGVPGAVAMLKLAHEDHGTLEWGTHFDRAISLAENGFKISPRLYSMIERMDKYLPKSIEDGPLDAYEYFYDADGQAYPVGHVLKNAEYANTLRTLAEDASALYRGALAEEIVAQVSRPPRAGSLSVSDLASYEARRRTALCMPHREHSLCGPPPPSSWLATAMVAGIGARGPEFSPEGAADPYNWKLFVEAQRLAYVDREQFVADDQFVDVPVTGMLSDPYLAERASSISGGKASEIVAAGDPWPYQNSSTQRRGLDASNDVPGTTHFVVVDFDGNVVSMTATVESIFGSSRMAGGMFLNNQLTDFSSLPIDADGVAIANAVAPGKRPRSSMSPTIVVDEQGEFVMATGSPGGGSIIAYTAKTLVGVLDWGLSAQQAVDLPNVVARGGVVRVESARASDELIDYLKNENFNVKESAGENSGLSVVVVQPDGGLHGGVDPRREGTIEIVHPLDK